MANKAIDKYYLLESLKDFNTSILLNYFQKKIVVSTVPSSPVNGDVIIYIGTTSGSFIQGHTYKYSNGWVDITPTGASSWGNIGGTLSSQIDLQNALDNKYDINNPIESSIGLGDNIPLFSTTCWEPMTWSSLTNFDGNYVWTDGINIYYSYPSTTMPQYKLNGTTWETMTWSGLTSLNGINIWTDGVNTYYSSGVSHYKLNGTTWESITWSGLTTITGAQIWTDGVNTYYSYNINQYKLNGTTWEPMAWSGLTGFNGQGVWTDKTNIYYSSGTDQYKLNGTTWEPMVWSGLTNFYGTYIWSDGVNTYYSRNINQYKLNGTTWEPIAWSGLTGFDGYNIWSDGVNTYFSNGTNQHKLAKINIKKNTSLSAIKNTICDEYTPLVTQSNSIVVFDNLDPNYGYKLKFNNDSNATSVSVPKYTDIKREDGTTSGTIKLTYTISGGTNGSSQFVLKIER